VISIRGSLLAANLATDAATTVDDLTTTLGPHACTETDSTAALDVADSSWVVHCHIVKSPFIVTPGTKPSDSGSDCRP
jgi:hypothetical protein